MPRGPAPPHTTMAHPQVVLVGRVLTYLVGIYRSLCDSMRPGWQRGPWPVASGTTPHLQGSALGLGGMNVRWIFIFLVLKSSFS